MTKIIVVLFVLLVFSSLNTGKAAAEKSEEKTDNTENIKSDDDEDESDSIQVVQRDVVTEKIYKSIVNDEKPHEEENYTEVLKHTNLTKAEAKYDKLLEDLNSDSSEIILENRGDIIEVSIPVHTSIEKNHEYSNRQEQIEIVIEDITKAYNHDANTHEDSLMIDEDENNWRSAEHLDSDNKKFNNEATHQEISVEETDRDFSNEDYEDKTIGLEVRDRMETRKPERRKYINTRPMNARHYGPPDHGIIDPGPIRSFSEIVVPRYRPVLTRGGIVYKPTLFSMQTGSPLLDRLSGRNWVSNRAQIHPEADVFPKPRNNRVIGVPQYEDSKMIDDYNDYGANTYSYTPVRKVTTQAPPQQINTPNKFDVFQKLVEASNYPKSQKRTFNELPGNYHSNYHSQRQYPESYGSFDVPRVRRHAWNKLPFQDI